MIFRLNGSFQEKKNHSHNAHYNLVLKQITQRHKVLVCYVRLANKIKVHITPIIYLFVVKHGAIDVHQHLKPILRPDAGVVRLQRGP